MEKFHKQEGALSAFHKFEEEGLGKIENNCCK